MKTKVRIEELDGLRGIAVLMVVVWHFIGAIIDTEFKFLNQLIFVFTRPGRVGVDLFFVLSGFLITGIILDRKNKILTFLKSFYIRRALRILPIYFVLLSLFYLGIWLKLDSEVFNNSIPIQYLLTFSQNIWMAFNGVWGPSGISVTWSVAIEEQFYIFFPVILILIPYKKVPHFLIGLAIASALLRLGVYLYFIDDSLPKAAFLGYVFTLSRLDGLCLGALVSFSIRDNHILQYLKSKANFIYKLYSHSLKMLLVLIVCMKISLVKTMFYWGHSFLSLFFALLIFLIVTNDNHKRWNILRSKKLQFFGSISYFIYLFHGLILSLVFIMVGRPEKLSSFIDFFYVSIAFFLTVFFATISQAKLEKPLINYGRKFQY